MLTQNQSEVESRLKSKSFDSSSCVLLDIGKEAKESCWQLKKKKKKNHCVLTVLACMGKTEPGFEWLVGPKSVFAFVKWRYLELTYSA